MADKTESPNKTYTGYSQLDDTWQRVMLGVSSTTIGANGCLLCAIASGLTDAGVLIQGLPADPPRLSRWLSRNGGFVAPLSQTKERSLFVFDSLRPLGVKLVDYIDARKKAAPLDGLEEALNTEGYFAAIHVDFRPGGSAQQHWVRAVAWYDHDIKVMDPWIKGSTQDAYLMTRYALIRLLALRRLIPHPVWSRAPMCRTSSTPTSPSAGVSSGMLDEVSWLSGQIGVEATKLRCQVIDLPAAWVPR